MIECSCDINLNIFEKIMHAVFIIFDKNACSIWRVDFFTVQICVAAKSIAFLAQLNAAHFLFVEEKI